MANMPEVVIVFFGDDWMGLYVNGDLKLENHSLSAEEVARAILGRGPEVLGIEDEEVLESFGWTLPKSLSSLREGFDEAKESLEEV